MFQYVYNRINKGPYLCTDFTFRFTGLSKWSWNSVASLFILRCLIYRPTKRGLWEIFVCLQVLPSYIVYLYSNEVTFMKIGEDTS